MCIVLADLELLDVVPQELVGVHLHRARHRLLSLLTLVAGILVMLLQLRLIPRVELSITASIRLQLPHVLDDLQACVTTIKGRLNLKVRRRWLLVLLLWGEAPSWWNSVTKQVPLILGDFPLLTLLSLLCIELNLLRDSEGFGGLKSKEFLIILWSPLCFELVWLKILFHLELDNVPRPPWIWSRERERLLLFCYSFVVYWYHGGIRSSAKAALSVVYSLHYTVDCVEGLLKVILFFRLDSSWKNKDLLSLCILGSLSSVMVRGSDSHVWGVLTSQSVMSCLADVLVYRCEVLDRLLSLLMNLLVGDALILDCELCHHPNSWLIKLRGLFCCRVQRWAFLLRGGVCRTSDASHFHILLLSSFVML